MPRRKGFLGGRWALTHESFPLGGAETHLQDELQRPEVASYERALVRPGSVTVWLSRATAT